MTREGSFSQPCHHGCGYMFHFEFHATSPSDGLRHLDLQVNFDQLGMKIHFRTCRNNPDRDLVI